MIVIGQHVDRDRFVAGVNAVIPRLDPVDVQGLNTRRAVAVAVEHRVGNRFLVVVLRQRGLVGVLAAVELHDQRAARVGDDGHGVRGGLVRPPAGGARVGAGHGDRARAVEVVAVRRAVDDQLRHAAAIGAETRAGRQIARQQAVHRGRDVDGALQNVVELVQVGHHHTIGIDPRRALPVVGHRVEVVLAVVRLAIPAVGAVVRPAHRQGIRIDVVGVQEVGPQRLFGGLNPHVLIVLAVAASVLVPGQGAGGAQAERGQAVGQEIRHVLCPIELARIGKPGHRSAQGGVVIGAAIGRQAVDVGHGVARRHPGGLRIGGGAENHHLHAHLAIPVVAGNQIGNGLLGQLQTRLAAHA